MAAKDERRLYETDMKMELTLKRVVKLYADSEEKSLPTVVLSEPPREEVVDRVIKKVRRL